METKKVKIWSDGALDKLKCRIQPRKFLGCLLLLSGLKQMQPETNTESINWILLENSYKPMLEVGSWYHYPKYLEIFGLNSKISLEELLRIYRNGWLRRNLCNREPVHASFVFPVGFFIKIITYVYDKLFLFWGTELKEKIFSTLRTNLPNVAKAT